MTEPYADPFPPPIAPPPTASSRGWQFWLGWVLTFIPAAMLLSGSVMA